jgi:hypothetical protein
MEQRSRSVVWRRRDLVKALSAVAAVSLLAG